MCYIEETCPLMLPGVFGYSDTFGAALVINGSMRYNGKNNIINKGPFTIRFHFISHENMTTYGIEWIF